MGEEGEGRRDGRVFSPSIVGASNFLALETSSIDARRLEIERGRAQAAEG